MISGDEEIKTVKIIHSVLNAEEWTTLGGATQREISQSNWPDILD